uniref:Hsp90 chaperone protein kinase-targeting subunit n=1 Tax=Heterorhabditis bacteriophora TaxID=37862 RepID=A0A1I7XTP3_HETBA
MPIDYSKWKKIEVSDDEDDTHPNIDTPSLYRWRHQARLERMAEKKQRREEIDKNKTTNISKIEELEQKLNSANLDEVEKEKIEKELADTKEQEAKWRAKEKELEEQERLEPWNIDTIGHEAFSSSRINKVNMKKAAPKLSDEEDSKRMAKFFEENEQLLQTYGRLTGLSAAELFLMEHPQLASEYSANYLTIECLNLAIDNKIEEMSVMAKQCIIMQYLLELAKSMNAVATNTNIIKAFFKKFAQADPQYMKLYNDEVAAFEDRLKRRAKEKREAAIAEYEAEEKEKRIAAAPGGLDPQEVYESLPEVMRAAFDSQEVQKLQEVALSMDKEVVLHIFIFVVRTWFGVNISLTMKGFYSAFQEGLNHILIQENEGLCDCVTNFVELLFSRSRWASFVKGMNGVCHASQLRFIIPERLQKRCIGRPVNTMRVLLLLASWAFLCKSQTHKCLLVSKFTQLVTGFLTAEQISRIYTRFLQGIDIAAIGVHNGKGVDEIIEGINHRISYFKLFSPYFISIIQVRINSQTPETTYKSMLEQLNQPLITGIVHLIHDTLTPQEWTSFSHRFNNIINLNI